MTSLRLLKQWQVLRIRAKPLDAVPVLAAAAWRSSSGSRAKQRQVLIQATMYQRLPSLQKLPQPPVDCLAAASLRRAANAVTVERARGHFSALLATHAPLRAQA